ncbi:hypothetical protein [Nocardia sp. NBC_01009]|uniref:hypothetical protein n=1 Tax=Nocardia sp. NBC_01009 TaxID=2975996 RepID=UPI00386F59E1|nr:hypothetical protein OHA42_04960 [Nocardia sp. NBC_01009]
MARITVTLNHGEVGRLLRTAFGDDVAALANRVATQAGKGARVYRYTTDRQAAAVSVPAYRQAKHGALTKAAAAAGLIVRGNL